MFKAASLIPLSGISVSDTKKRYNIRKFPARSVMLVWVLAVLNTAVFFSYLMGVNSGASVGYEIRHLQQKISEFKEENKKSTIQIAEKTSVAGLENELQNLNLVVAGTPIFLQDNYLTQR